MFLKFGMSRRVDRLKCPFCWSCIHFHICGPRAVEHHHYCWLLPCCWCFSPPCQLELLLLFHTCPCKSQKSSPLALQHVQHLLVTELDLVLQTLHKFSDKINIGVHRLFKCAPFSSCFDNFLELFFLLFLLRFLSLLYFYSTFTQSLLTIT